MYVKLETVLPTANLHEGFDLLFIINGKINDIVWKVLMEFTTQERVHGIHPPRASVTDLLVVEA